MLYLHVRKRRFVLILFCRKGQKVEFKEQNDIFKEYNIFAQRIFQVLILIADFYYFCVNFLFIKHNTNY